MATYTVPDLAQRGARYAFALLLQRIRDGDEPFITYKSVVNLLEKELNIPKVFPTHIGWVAGQVMKDIETVADDAPPINALVTRANGIPGSGIGEFYNNHWRHRGYRTWAKLGLQDKLAFVAEVRGLVRAYDKWDSVYRQLYGAIPPVAVRLKHFTEMDGKPADVDRKPGTGESDAHRLLKEWAAKNPRALGLPVTMRGKPEAPLPSGDRIDVLFEDDRKFVAVEVKSRLSSQDDLQRGIYQCVKYRAVLQAREQPVEPDVGAILLSENELSTELADRARLLEVRVVNYRLNSNK